MFTAEEAADIQLLLGRIRRADRSQQKILRDELRRRLGFYISDFHDGGPRGYTAADFDRDVAARRIEVRPA
jgi:hypothetical protein